MHRKYVLRRASDEVAPTRRAPRIHSGLAVASASTGDEDRKSWSKSVLMGSPSVVESERLTAADEMTQ